MYLSAQSSQDSEETRATRFRGRCSTSQQKHGRVYSVAVFEGGEETGENSAATEQIFTESLPKITGLVVDMSRPHSVKY